MLGTAYELLHSGKHFLGQNQPSSEWSLQELMSSDAFPAHVETPASPSAHPKRNSLKQRFSKCAPAADAKGFDAPNGQWLRTLPAFEHTLPPWERPANCVIQPPSCLFAQPSGFCFKPADSTGLCFKPADPTVDVTKEAVWAEPVDETPVEPTTTPKATPQKTHPKPQSNNKPQSNPPQSNTEPTVKPTQTKPASRRQRKQRQQSKQLKQQPNKPSQHTVPSKSKQPVPTTTTNNEAPAAEASPDVTTSYISLKSILLAVVVLFVSLAIFVIYFRGQVTTDFLRASAGAIYLYSIKDHIPCLRVCCKTDKMF